MNERYTVYLKDLKGWANDYNGRLVGLHIVKEYNELELLLLEVTQQLFFPGIQQKKRERSYYQAVERQIKKSLTNKATVWDLTNNRHLIAYYKNVSAEYKIFLNIYVREYNITWEDFFEFISILRNAISHNRGTFTEEGLKALNEKYELILTLLFDIHSFDRIHFTIQLKTDSQHNFWNLINDFAANTIKILAEEKTLDFIA